VLSNEVLGKKHISYIDLFDVPQIQIGAEQIMAVLSDSGSILIWEAERTY
jgi:hypothetical protein